MSKSYPAKVKTDISKGVENAKKDAKKKAYANSEIPLTDHYNINKMRVTYFKIEKNVSTWVSLYQTAQRNFKNKP